MTYWYSLLDSLEVKYDGVKTEDGIKYNNLWMVISLNNYKACK